MIDDIEQAALDALREPHKSIHVLPERERVREQIEDIVFSAFGCEGSVGVRRSEEATNQILAIDGLEVRADNQIKPQLQIDIHQWRDYSPNEAYQQAQDDMQDAGFVKVVK